MSKMNLLAWFRTRRLTLTIQPGQAIIRPSILLIIFLFHVLQLQAQDKQIDNALLWKITGKSLLKPSFLFGTIHLQDKRVFNFNDSLYSFIQRADGFAMEIHPDSVVSALMQKADEEASDQLLKKHLKKEEFDQLKRMLKKELGIDANRLTLREAYLLKDHLSKPAPRADDMPTFVDAYLYGMARNQGKEIVGLEKASDQVNMLDDVQGDFDVRGLLKSLKKEKSLTEKLIRLYIREDLQAIQSLMSYLPEETEDKLLTMRNYVMVDKMDSIIQSKSFVVAVGTAHLPGKKGMIELLRQKGYTVEPVFASSRTHANNYAIKAEHKAPWVDVKEPKLGYRTRMPGKPSPMDMLNGNMKMNMYMDLTSMKLYYAAFVVPVINVTVANADSILQTMCKNAMAASKGQAISNKRFIKDKFEAIDFVYKQTTDKMYARIQAMAMGKRVYLIGFGSSRQEDLHAKEADDFFDAFTIEDMAAQAWETQTFSDYFFSISLPSIPKKIILPVVDSSVSSVQFNSMDNTRGIYYGLTVVTANPGYVVPDDSVYFASAVQRLQDNMVIYKLQQKDTSFRGFNAKRVKAALKDKLSLNCLLISRGNRVYNLMSISPAEDSAHSDIGAFFDSFSFVDYPQLKWQQEIVNDYAFSVPVSGKFSKINFLDEDEDKTADKRDYQWLSYDSASATSFFITRRVLSPYLWVKHDSILLKKYMNDLTEADETVTAYKFVRNGNSSGLEFHISKRNTSLAQRFRILLNDGAAYVLQTDVPHKYWKEYNFQPFLEGFRFSKEVKTDFLFTNSFNKLLADLRSADSLVHARAYDAIGDMIFDSTDIPALLKASTEEFILDTLHYYTASEKLLDAAASLKHPKFIEQIEKYYQSLTPSQEQFKYSLLNGLAKVHTEESYALIEKLLRKGLPVKGDTKEFVYHLADSLLLAKKLYPYLLRLSSDTLLSTELFHLHQQMLDSNLININEFRQHELLLLTAAKQELQKIAISTEEHYYAPGIFSMIKLLGSLNTEGSTAMLRELAKSRQINMKYYAVVQLLRNKFLVDAGTVLQLAADKGYRADLYEELKDLKQEKLFPAKYLNQKAFAESYLYNADEEDAVKTTFIGERTLSFRNNKQKFYLYKLTYEYDGKQNSYLGISGPFSTDGKIITLPEQVAGVYWEEEFKQSLIEKHLKAFLAQYEIELPSIEEISQL